jgi:hypothetical protein
MSDPSIVCAPAEQAILRVVSVKVHRGVDAFIAELERGKSILRRCGVEADIRAWLATYAGTETGTLLVTLEFADQGAFFRSEQAFAKAPEDAEFGAWSRRLPELRSVMSDCLHVELTTSGGA